MIFVLQYVACTYGTFSFEELETRLFKTREKAEEYILEVARKEYPDDDPSEFENIDALNYFLENIFDDDRPAIIYTISEMTPIE